MDILQTYKNMLLHEAEDDFSTDLESFKERWNKIGVEHRLFHKNNHLHLDEIVVPKHVQRTGIGTAYMNELTNLADKHQKTLHLTPATDWGASKTGLHNFYKRAGMVYNKGRNKDYTVTSTMIRPPKKFVAEIEKKDLRIEPEKKIALKTVADTTISKHIKNDEFNSWFAGSKVSNMFGDPVIAYHGSPNIGAIRSTGFKDSKDGIFFTNDPKTAKSYHNKRDFDDSAKPGTVLAHLKMLNPYMHDHEGKEWFGTQEVIRKAKSLGHDGVIINNVVDHYQTNKTKQLTPSKVFVVFNKDQIHTLD